MKIATVFFDLGNTLLYSDVPSPERVQAACRVMADEFAGRGYPVTPVEFAANLTATGHYCFNCYFRELFK